MDGFNGIVGTVDDGVVVVVVVVGTKRDRCKKLPYFDIISSKSFGRIWSINVDDNDNAGDCCCCWWCEDVIDVDDDDICGTIDAIIILIHMTIIIMAEEWIWMAIFQTKKSQLKNSKQKFKLNVFSR